MHISKNEMPLLESNMMNLVVSPQNLLWHSQKIDAKK